MKVKSLLIDKFKGLKDFKIDFNDAVTVLIGENGTGKTTILETIYHMLTYPSTIEKNKIIENNPFGNIKSYPFLSQDEDFKGCKINVSLTSAQEMHYANIMHGIPVENDRTIELILVSNNRTSIATDGTWEEFKYIASMAFIGNYKYTKEAPHVVYLPAEINFEKIKSESVKKLDESAEFGIMLDSKKISSGLKEFLVYQHHRDLEDLESGEKGTRIKRYKELFNSFFEDKEFIGIKDLEPLFRIKSTGEIHSVDELSSGEKQIFFRAGSIMEYNLQDSIILIDEPETSMHPEWQQKILDFYKKVAGNNQLIIATHSPHIVSSCQKEEVRVLVRENGAVKINEYIEGTYGRTIEQLLLSVFNLESVREKSVQKKIDEFKELYINKDKRSDSEKNKMKSLKKELSSYLDPDDPELSLIDIEEGTNKLKELMKKLEADQNA